MRRVSVLLVAGLLVCAGCTAPSSIPGESVERDGEGVVAGYEPTDRIDVDASDGLTEAELDAVKYRAMARLETLRGLEFEEDVDVEVIGRDELDAFSRDGPADAYTNELWRGAFVVDEETDVNAALNDLYGGSIQGYYAGGSIVIVSDDPDDLRVSRSTLVHELVHALQDQHFGLARNRDTIDAERAATGLIEGEANYLTSLYDRRCGEEWECVADPESETGQLSDRPFNAGLFLSIYVPYSAGPPFVDHVREGGGWAAVDAAHDNKPASTAQLLHPERYPDDDPRAVAVEDRSSADWEPIRADGEIRTQTVGEATLFAALWYNEAVDRPLTEGAPPYGAYNYSHPATDGWAGDSFVAYENGDENGNETAHVWRLAWESSDDAAAFRDAYVDVLEHRGADPIEDGDVAAADVADVYRIPDDASFSGAYRVTLEGDAVEIVRAPAVGDLEGVREPTADLGAVGAVEPDGASPTAGAGDPIPASIDRTAAPSGSPPVRAA